MSLEIKIIILLLFFTEKPNEYDDITINNQPSNDTHNHAAQFNQITMI